MGMWICIDVGVSHFAIFILSFCVSPFVLVVVSFKMFLPVLMYAMMATLCNMLTGSSRKV